MRKVESSNFLPLLFWMLGDNYCEFLSTRQSRGTARRLWRQKSIEKCGDSSRLLRPKVAASRAPSHAIPLQRFPLNFHSWVCSFNSPSLPFFVLQISSLLLGCFYSFVFSLFFESILKLKFWTNVILEILI